MNGQIPWTPPSAHSDGGPVAEGQDHDSPSKTKASGRRTRTGCRTCRHRKVKCDEKKPVCSQCFKGKRLCEWPGPGGAKKPRLSRRPNATACDACREKKLKCVGDIQDACEKCRNSGIQCVRSSPSARQPSFIADTADSGTSLPAPTISPPAFPAPLSHGPSLDALISTPLSGQHQSATEASLPLHHVSATQPPGASSVFAPPAASWPPTVDGGALLPSSRELEELVALYFTSVHHFGFLGFIHQLHFHRLLRKGKAPRELTLVMIASAMRFAAPSTPENLARADAWVDAAVGAILPRVYQGFGAIQLMTLLLAQHYDLNRGNFTSAWLLGANCTRMMQMMSLQTFDRTYPSEIASNMKISPLLSSEALRRVAWSTFYLDSVIDGGRYGFHTVDENAYRVQLPCDEASFLSNERVVTEPLFPDAGGNLGTRTSDAVHAPLDMSGHLLRIAAARRRALYVAFKASHRDRPVEQLNSELEALEVDLNQVIASLPKRFRFDANSVFLYRDRLVTFILLHILRHNLFIIYCRAALQVYQRDPNKAELIPQVRRDRIARALPIAGLVSEGLKAGVHWDPQIGVQCYVSLEILLFEPRRLAEIDPLIDPKAPEIMEAITCLLTAIRDIGSRSEFVKQLHIEAVLRLLRFEYTQLLNETDIVAFRSEYRLVGQEAAEYDFRDFRWARLERIRRGGANPSANMALDEALLEYKADESPTVPSVVASPKLDAMDASTLLAPQPTTQPVTSVPSSTLDLTSPQGINEADLGQDAQSQPWLPLAQPENDSQIMLFDWAWWLMDRTGPPGYPNADPISFESQIGM